MGTYSTTLQVPADWNGITVAQQLRVDQLAKEHPDFQPLAAIAGYCNLTMDEVKKMHLQNIKEILDNLTFLHSPLPVDPITKFTYKGDTYSVIQSLLKAEFQDFISLEGALERFKNDPHKALPYVVAIMCKKQGESLSDFDIEERQAHFLDLPITTASRVQAFFLISAKLFTVDSRKILEAQNLILTESMNSILGMEKKQVGTGIFSRWLMAILRAYIKSLKKNWNTYYSGYNSRPAKQNWIQTFKGWFKKKLKRK